ncbi:hypothetical protein H0H87_012476 [Tephrocybe sp. NHM501043]|nr:hypothetical protein H0H87_012476 [Tephrocybe sp. NHM501043]
MPVPQRVSQWVDEQYKRPRVDPQWLNECYNWLVNEGDHDPDTRFQDLVDAIKYQILESSLSDSMLPGTGLPTHIAHTETKTVLTGQEIFVEITALTEIGSSAFSLNQTRIAREERIKEGNIIDDEGEGDIDVSGEGPMPKYSRSMLRFELTDGTTTVPAIEYRNLPELSLENTPLGFKVFVLSLEGIQADIHCSMKLLLKGVRVYKGIIWLEPRNVVLLGHRADERECHREADFARGLRARMRLPEPAQDNNPMACANPPGARQPSAPLPPVIRSPLREISPPPSPAMYLGNDDEDLETRRRRIPNRNPDPSAPSRSTASTSSYFADALRSQTLVGTPALSLPLSPTLRQSHPNLPPALPSPQPEDKFFWSDDENENLLQLEERKDMIRRTGGKEQQTRSMAQRTNNGTVASGSKGKGKRAEVNISSDEYDDGDMFDNDIFADLDAIEKAYVDAPNPLPASLAGSGPNAGESTDHNVIEIDSDEDDKENTPVPTRHVRRRVGGGLAQGNRGGQTGRPVVLAKTAEDIVELSDSD